jgi:hypothetical protein
VAATEKTKLDGIAVPKSNCARGVASPATRASVRKTRSECWPVTSPTETDTRLPSGETSRSRAAGP